MKNYNNLSAHGSKLLSTFLMVGTAALIFAGILAMSGAGALDGDHMQNAAGSNIQVTNQVIRKGWGFMPGNGKFAIEDTPINYGITFDELPFLIVKFANSRQIIDGEPYDLADCRTTRNVIAAGVNQTNSGFKPILRTPTGLGFPSITNYCYTWIAIGRHDTSYDGETDPVFTNWDKSTGINIAESQISDLSHTSDADIASMGYIKSYTETDPIWTTASANYYTKTNMQTYGESQVHWNNLANKPAGLDDGDDNVPAGFMILGTVITPPPGYTYTGDHVVTGNGDSWAAKNSMPTARINLAAAAVNNKVYVIGGWNGSYLGTNEEYDPATDSWTTKTNMPTNRFVLAAAAANNKIYAIGGDNGSILNTNEEYDPATNSWATKSGMSSGRGYLAAVTVNNKIYAIGGNTGSTPVTTNEEYDPATDSWTTKNSMSTPRHGLAAATVNNKIYAIGGWAGSYMGTNEEYDPAIDSWTAKSSMPTIRYILAAAAANNKIYAIGGNDSSVLSTNEEYDPAADSWTAKSNISTVRQSLAAATVNNKIYAIGGYNGSSYLSNNEEYAPPSFYYIHIKD